MQPEDAEHENDRVGGSLLKRSGLKHDPERDQHEESERQPGDQIAGLRRSRGVLVHAASRRRNGS